MFFSISKIFWFFAAPSHVLGLLILAAALCAILRRVTATRILLLMATALLIVAGILPTGDWLTRALEDRYPRAAWPAHVDGILVLSGGVSGEMMQDRGVTSAYGGHTRLIAGMEAARRYPDAKFVFTGGSGLLAGARSPEAEAARRIFLQMGLPPSRLILESRSRNTYENFALSKQLVQPKPQETWLLVTSAIHMPRAMGIARQVEWNVVPWPSDYLTMPGDAGISFEIASNIAATDGAVHEWIGLLAYRLSGKAR